MSKHVAPRKRLILILLGFLAFVCVLGYRYVSVEFFPNFSVSADQQVYVYVYAGTTVDDIRAQLEQADVVNNVSAFVSYASRSDYASRFRTGRYRVLDGMTNRTLIKHILSGAQEPVQFKFNNIRTKEQLSARIAKQLMVDSVTIHALLDSAAFLKPFQVTPETSLVLFIPNTYEIYWNISAEKLVERMYQESQRFWNSERLAQAKAAHLTPTEVSILASIVDEETNIAHDKPIIAGLYLNRMHRGMPLQACPTVKYAVGDFSLTRILSSHTRVDSPYNTYKYKGLPPGPIRMASIQGIDAVLNYMPSNYIYMCASDKLDGTHNFAATYAEHSRHSQRYHLAYQKWLRRKEAHK